jgi:hypothetical protein
MSTGTAATNPAIGPEAPSSTSASRLGAALRVMITAPNVPMAKGVKGGMGMKNGRLASIRRQIETIL